jgi:thiamine-phosphate diphosphorylase
LVAIADTLRDGLDELAARSLAAVENGATAIQVRLKGEDARTLLDACRALTAALRVPVLVHDRTDVAVAARAAGVHLSPDEIPAAALRLISPPGFVIGASVGTTDDLTLAADANAALAAVLATTGAEDPAPYEAAAQRLRERKGDVASLARAAARA